jgi:hypothetical protein
MPLKVKFSWVRVAHACNPSYSGGRDQEDHGSKPSQAEFKRPYFKKLFTKIVEWLKIKALSSNPSTAKKKKKKGIHLLI